MSEHDLAKVGFAFADRALHTSFGVEHVEIRQELYKQFCAEKLVKNHVSALSALNKTVTIPGDLLSAIASRHASRHAAAIGGWGVTVRDVVSFVSQPVAYQVAGNNDVRGMYHRVAHENPRVGLVYVSTAGKYLFQSGEKWHFAAMSPLTNQATINADDSGPADGVSPCEECVPLLSSTTVLPSNKECEWLMQRGTRSVAVKLNVRPSHGDCILAGDHDALAFEPDMLQQKADKAAIEKAKLAAYADVLRKRISTTEEARQR